MACDLRLHPATFAKSEALKYFTAIEAFYTRKNKKVRKNNQTQNYIQFSLYGIGFGCNF